MAYEALAGRLADAEGRRSTDGRVACLPDGSVDAYYEAFDAGGDRIETREAFADRIARGGPASIPVERTAREPGGQSVGMARQVHALGAGTALYGHLDDPVFADLPFEPVSMGAPSEIRVFPFADDDLLFADRSSGVRDWTLADLEAAAGDARDALAADAVCCGNWASIDGLTDALSTLAAAPLAADTVVFDPGAIRARSPEAVRALLDALGDLDERTDVVYSVNRAELAATVAAVDGASTTDANGPSPADDGPDGDHERDGERLERVRYAAGITAAVMHEADVAAVATRAGEAVVPNLEVDDPRRRTGAGDRFSGALAVGRLRGWEWETTLALGNCCASYYVATASTADPAALRSSLEERR